MKMMLLSFKLNTVCRCSIHSICKPESDYGFDRGNTMVSVTHSTTSNEDAQMRRLELLGFGSDHSSITNQRNLSVT